jgi:hypothetical protein
MHDTPNVDKDRNHQPAPENQPPQSDPADSGADVKAPFAPQGSTTSLAWVEPATARMIGER